MHILTLFTILLKICLISFVSSAGPKQLVATDVFLQDSSTKPMLQGGNSTGVGGDAVDDRLMSAWFYGQEPIITCYNSLEMFGASDIEITSAIEAAVLKWKNYFIQKKINTGDRKNHINTNFKLKGKCKGDEDLVFHFGTGPIFGNIQDLKASSTLRQPIAYVNKTHLSRDQRWAKGYVRLVHSNYYAFGLPNWENSGALEIMLLHEFGHVLGFIHEPSTIMDGALISRLFNLFEIPNSKPILAQIDQNQELIHCLSCQRAFQLTDHSENQEALRSWNKFYEIQKDNSQSAQINKELASLILNNSSISIQIGNKALEVKNIQTIPINRTTILKSNFPKEIQSEKRAFLLKGNLKDRNVLVIVNSSELTSGSHLELHLLQANGENSILRFERKPELLKSEDREAQLKSSSRPAEKARVPAVPQKTSLSNVSLLNDENAISCKNLASESSMSLWLDRKDKELKITRSGITEIFQSERFMDSAVLFKSTSSESYAVLQILEDAHPILIIGELLGFKENLCEDTGSSKRCNLSFQQPQQVFTWSPEVLKLQKEGREKELNIPLDRYGVLPNDATYFLAVDSDDSTLALYDFGSELKLLKGKTQKLICIHE